MSIDFLGDILGKARRRKLEGAVAVNLGSIAKRVGLGAAVAGLAAAKNPDLLGTKSGLLTLAGIGLAAMIPAGAAPAGILTPAQPGSLSASEAAVQGAVTLITAPAASRQAAQAATNAAAEAKLQAAVSDGLRALAPVIVSQGHGADQQDQHGRLQCGAARPGRKTCRCRQTARHC